eukprot:jgi/Mesvir1/7131/Mv09232-RA.1
MDNVIVSLAKYQPSGPPAADLFKAERKEKPKVIPAGHFLVHVHYVSVDPYMSFKVRQAGGEGEFGGFDLGKPMDGFLCGVVEEVGSGVTLFKKGDIVSGTGPYIKYQVVDEKKAHLSVVNGLCDDHLSYLIGVLGMPGCTAWAGLKYKLEAKAGQVLFVSGAAGAVGSLVGQLAKLQGLQVIGSAGSADKCAKLVKEYGLDYAFNYKDCQSRADVAAKLREGSPDGIDLFFDNVGGILLQGALDALKEHGRIALCGQISRYSAPDMVEMVPDPAPTLLLKQARMEGFIVFEFLMKPDVVQRWHEEVGGYLKEGKLKVDETHFDVDRIGEGLQALFQGGNVGKVVVKM